MGTTQIQSNQINLNGLVKRRVILGANGFKRVFRSDFLRPDTLVFCNGVLFQPEDNDYFIEDDALVFVRAQIPVKGDIITLLNIG